MSISVQSSTPYETELKQLESQGFKSRNQNLSLLKRTNGDVSTVSRFLKLKVAIRDGKKNGNDITALKSELVILKKAIPKSIQTPLKNVHAEKVQVENLEPEVSVVPQHVTEDVKVETVNAKEIPQLEEVKPSNSQVEKAEKSETPVQVPVPLIHEIEKSNPVQFSNLYETELKQLESQGFKANKQNLNLLKKTNGNVTTVSQLLKLKVAIRDGKKNGNDVTTLKSELINLKKSIPKSKNFKNAVEIENYPKSKTPIEAPIMYNDEMARLVELGFKNNKQTAVLLNCCHGDVELVAKFLGLKKSLREAKKKGNDFNEIKSELVTLRKSIRKRKTHENTPAAVVY